MNRLYETIENLDEFISNMINKNNFNDSEPVNNLKSLTPKEIRRNVVYLFFFLTSFVDNNPTTISLDKRIKDLINYIVDSTFETSEK